MPLTRGWTNSVDDGLTNKKWDVYDTLIKAEVAEYNARLGKTPGFESLDWLIFKAMAWVESGANSPQWTIRPMQIGNKGDPGYQTLIDGDGAAPLIMSDDLKTALKNGDINQPQLNIRAGIAFALVRLSKSDFESVDDPTQLRPVVYTVRGNDHSLHDIARRERTTVQSLQDLNGLAAHVIPGRKLLLRRASTQRVIFGWRPLTTANMGKYYNAGDPAYKDKLNYVLALFPKLKR